MNEQLPLKLSFPESLRFDNFVPGNNQQAIASLKSLLEQPEKVKGGKKAGHPNLLFF